MTIRTVVSCSLMLAAATGASGCGAASRTTGDGGTTPATGRTPQTGSTPATAAPSIPHGTEPWSTVRVYPVTTTAHTEEAALTSTPRGDTVASWLVPATTKTSPNRTQFAFVGPDGGRVSAETAIHARAERGTAFRGTYDAPILTDSARAGSDASKPAIDDLSQAGKLVGHHPLALAYPKLATIDMAVGPSGDVIVAWITYKEVDSDYGYAAKVEIATAAPGQPLGAARTLATQPKAAEPYDDAIAVAVGKNGNAVVVTGGISRGGIGVWAGSTRTGFSGREIVEDFPWSGSLAVVMTSSGRAVIASGDTNGGEDPDHPYVVSATSLAPGGSALAPVQTVDPGHDKQVPTGGLALASGPGGTATLAWTGVDSRQPGGTPANVSVADADGHFGATQRLGTSAAVERLAIRPTDGAALVTVDGCAVPGTRRRATACVFTRSSNAGPFGSAEPLPVPKDAGLPDPSFDGRTGRPSIAYLSATKGNPHAQLVIVTRDRP